MPVDGEVKIVPTPEKVIQEPIGPVLIGPDNPVGMSREIWANNPHLLFHGASAQFEFKRDFNYKTDQVEAVHSHTVGQGFYATPQYHDALLYSQAFGGEKDPVVISLLPYQARMFDFRDSSLSHNALVPNEMFHAYHDFYCQVFSQKWRDYDPVPDNEFIKTHPLGEPDLERRANPLTVEDFAALKPTPYAQERSDRVRRLQSYKRALRYDRLLSSKEESGDRLDLREMLSILGSSEASEYASGIFSEFMKAHGYDGAIYLEGGDHPDHKNPTSYIFYQLDKLGTFEIWNPPALASSH